MPFSQKPIEILITDRQSTMASYRMGSDKMGSDRMGSDRTGSDRMGSDYSESDKRQAFWQPLRGRLRTQELSIAALEGHTIREFDILMMRALTNLWRTDESLEFEKSSRDPEARSSLWDKLRGSKKPQTPSAHNLEKTAIASRIVVKTEIDHYSSLGLLMSLEPIKEVINLFEGNFDYFQVFLGSYIPIAFAQAVGDEAFADGMEYEIEVPPSLKNQFVQSDIGDQGTHGTSQSAPKQIGKANWAWIVSNTSLVVPVFLAAAILYIASTKLNDWTGSERKAFERLIDLQAQAISEDRQRFKLLFDELQKKPEPSPTPQPVQAQRSPQRRTRRNRR